MEKRNLSNNEKNIWLVDTIYNNTSVNTLAGSLVIKKDLNVEIAKKTINEFVRQNDALRMKIVLDKDTPMQYVKPYEKFDVEVIDLSSKTDDEIKEIKNKIVSKPIDIYGDSLFEYTILDRGEDAGEIFLKVHHIISDAWSISKMGTDLSIIYEGILDGTYESLEKPGYFEYLDEEQEYLSGEKYIKDKEFFKEYLKDFVEPVKLKENEITSLAAKRYSKKIDEELLNEINEYCKENRVSMYNVFLAALYIYIYRITEKNDIVIGTPVLNRSNAKLKEIQGMFVSTIPLRMNIEEDKTFLDICKNVASESFNIFRHSKYPYSKLIEEYRKDTGSNGEIYDVMFSYQNARASLANDDRYEITWEFSNYIQDAIEIHILDLNDTNTLTINIDYITSLFEDIEIEYMLRRLIAVVKDGIINNKLVENIEIMDEEEKHKILYEFNDTKTDYPNDKTVIDLFEEQVEKTPNNIALVFEDKTLTYEELNNKANQLANTLIDNGVKEGDRVAVELDKSIENIASVIAILKIGATYVPIDIDFEIQRKEYIYENAECKICILNNTNANYKKILLIDNLNVEIVNNIVRTKNNNSESIAYIMYTSGSTGNPKGVMVTNKNIVRLVKNTNYISFNENDRIIQTGATAFDACTFEYWGTLLNGITLYLISKEHLILPEYLYRFINNNKITIMFITTALFNMMIDYKSNFFDSLRMLYTGGEAMSVEHINKAYSNCTNVTLHNIYGPTENTTFTSFYKIKKLHKINVPIGKPISNTTCYIVDSKLRVLPMFIEGELLNGGDGVAKGYLNNQKLTYEKFVKGEIFGGQPLYRSGDICKFDYYGNIIYLNRKDNQVKIRGYRIELDEIKNVLLQNSEIKNALVIVNKSNITNNKKIVAYYISDKEINKKDLLAYLKEKLPVYMIPSSLIQIDKFELNQNGKIDVRKLPNSKDDSNVLNPASTDIQKNIQELLNKIIEDNMVFDINENILEYGVDSLSIIKLSIELNNIYKIDIDVKEMLKGISILEIEKIINNSSKAHTKKVNIILTNELSNNQKGIFTSYVMNTEALNYNIPFEIKFDRNVDLGKLKSSIENVVNNIPNIFGHIEIEDSNIIQKYVKKNFKIDVQEIPNEQYDIIKEGFVKPFDLLEGPLFRIEMYKTETNIFVLFDFHHIVFDGTSIIMLLDRIKTFYEKGILIKNIIAPKVKDNQKYEKSKKYLLDEFSGELPVNDLPLDYKRPNEKTFAGDNIIIDIDEELTNRVYNFAKENTLTINSVFFAAYNILLSKYMYSEDIIIGMATMGRNSKAELDAIGMFVKTLPFRTKIDYNETTVNFIKHIQEHVIDSIENDEYSYDELVKELKIQRDPSRNPLFDVLYTYQNTNTSTFDIGQCVGQVNSLTTKSSKFDYTCQVENRNNVIQVKMEYCSTIISKSSATDFTKHFINIIKELVSSSNTCLIKDIEMITNEEKLKVLNEFNDTKCDYPKDKTATEIFEENVLKYEDKVAVVFEDKKLTYKELNEKANIVAHRIIENNVKEGATIALMMDKSIEFMIGALGALKANCVYMPMDKSMPDERVKFVLEDSSAALIITTKEYYRDVLDINHIFIDIDNDELYSSKENENLNLPSDSTKPAYIIYTSGSTGKPKGNIIIHQGITRLVLNTNYLFFRPEDIMMVSGSLTFDTTIFEIWGAMLFGMTLHFIPKEIIVNPSNFREYILTNKITTALIPTPIFNQLVEFDSTIFRNMHQICVGGDSFMAKYSNQVFESCPDLILTNVYGPAENAVICTANIIDKKYFGNIPIGKVTSNSTCYVVDKCDNLCPPRVPGELYVGGDGLGLGYLNRDELTKEKFTIPKCLNEKIYKTGDLTSWNTDGTINFKGRIDFQVKIRGQRIEISEIQNKMLEIKEIKEVVILALENKLGNKYLVAYYTLNAPYEETKIEEYLKTYLPIYMIPSRFVLLDNMPLNQNGKIDRKALPVVEENNTATKVKPENEVQEALLEVYRRVLNTKDYYMTDNFFDCGGDSLVAMKLAAEATNEGIPLVYAKIFDFPTPLQMYREIYVKENDLSLQDIIEDYDYSKINRLLESKINIKTNNERKAILLTGAAGFMGSHILDNLLSSTDRDIYCLIRRKDNIEPIQRLKDRLHFFFGNKYDLEFEKRIKVVEGDLTFETLFINPKDEKKVTENAGIIINTAAYVKHYGKKETFESVNINGVNNLIKFAINNNVKLVHISTLSVSGNMLEVGQIEQTKIKENTTFTEKDLFIGQELNNIYAYSKFIAERNILQNVLTNNLNAIILRVGNLTGRFSDGTFQPNVEENAFVGRIKSFINIGSVSKKMLDLDMEFTPIDLVADATVRLATSNNEQLIYHLYNVNHAKLSKIMVTLKNEFNITIDALDDKSQKEKINKYIENKETERINGILLDINSEKDIAYSSNIAIKCESSISVLKKLNFIWPNIEHEYIKKYFEYLRKIKFI